MDEIQKELLQSNELLRVQLWILGGAISIFLAVIVWFSKSAWSDMKTMLKEHDERIQKTELDIAVIKGREDNNFKEMVEEVIMKMRSI